MDNKISLIIPAYNVGSCLADTLDSVLAQTYTNMEVVIVNDGSRDNTAEVAEAYRSKDSRIVVIHKENGGVTSARLRGVREATGDWIGFVDGDDLLEPDMYERLLANALTHNSDISHCGYRMVFPNGRVDYYYNTGRVLTQDHDTGIGDLLSGSFVEPGLWNKLFRKSLFADVFEQMDSSIRINEDLLMNYYLFKAAETSVYEDFCPYHYVLRPGSAATSAVNGHKLRDPLKVTEILMEDAEAVHFPALQRRLTYQLINAATMDASAQPELILPHRKACRAALLRSLGRILFGRECGPKLKGMALWAAVWPWSYRMVHKLHGRITGHDKKYAIE